VADVSAQGEALIGPLEEQDMPPLAARAAGRPSVTVVVPTRNRGALIAQTLEALLALTYPALEILIVDQSTDDRTRQAVRVIAEADPRVRYHATPTVGSSAGRNIGALLSQADVVAYTDDDCIVTAGWIEAIADEMRDPGVAAVYGRLLPYGYCGRTGHDVGLRNGLERKEYTKRVPPWYIGHGGNMAFQRSDLLQVGGFDLLLSAGGLLHSGEDGDMSYRLLAAGRRVVYSPAALAYHRHWKAWAAQQQMQRAYGVGAGGQFAKYVRCGDYYGLLLLLRWIWQLGVRRIGAGLLKWHSTKPVYLGYCQLIYPWMGIWRSRHYAIDREVRTYLHPDVCGHEQAIVPRTAPQRSEAAPSLGHLSQETRA